jgi:methionyl-tRNA formyltransferase
VRALTPWPGSDFVLDGRRVRVLRAALAEGRGAPGEVLDCGPGRLVVACGEGALELLELQREGRAAMAAAAFLRGLPVAPGTVLP